MQLDAVFGGHVGKVLNWVRRFFLEMWFEDYRAAMSVNDTELPDEIEDFMPLHVVIDYASLHENVTKSNLPEDKRCALEVLALREMMTDRPCDSDSDAEYETERLKER